MANDPDLADVPHDPLDVDVLIVGGGPVGLLGGILASRHGLTALVVERRSGSQTAPAAHVVNARTYEICRQAGLDMERIRAAGQDEADAGHVNFVTRLGGELIGRLPFEHQGESCLHSTPTPLRNLSQHRFEPMLVDELRASPGVELRYGQRWEQATDVDGGVLSVMTDVETGASNRVRSRYLIGCDGAGSNVRRSLGIEMLGPPLLRCFLMIHFRANLRSLTAAHPAVLHFVLDPEAEGAFIAHDVDSDWVFMHAIDPEIESVDDYDSARCVEVIDRAAGCALDAEILGRSTWRMSAQVADGMGAGRTFIAGDAAHRFPPTGGLGLNSGVQDIHGLMWRIASVVGGDASTELLDSYEAERLPVARNNADQSVSNAVKMALLAEALGTHTDPSTERLYASLADPDRAGAIAAAVEEQREHFDMLGLQIGYVYESGAVVADGSVAAPMSVSDYTPSARPGSRLPHAWLDDVGGRSTLDLVPVDRPVLVSFGSHDAWRECLRSVSGTAGSPVHVRVGADIGPLEEWRETCGVGPSGAMLVRPDQHVAWRSTGGPAPDQLGLALDVIAGRRPSSTSARESQGVTTS